VDDFFKDIGEMGVLGDMLGGMVSGLAGSGLVPKNTPDGKLLAAQSELFTLKKQEAALLLEVGRLAYGENPSAYPQDSKLRLIRAGIDAAQASADEAARDKERSGGSAGNPVTAEEAKKRYTEAVAEFDTPDTRICPSCETRIRDEKLTRCFFCGTGLGAEAKPETATNKKQGGTSMASELSGKYYCIAAEADGQDMMAMLEMMAASMDKEVTEMMFVEVIGEGKLRMEMSGEGMDLEYTRDGDTIKTVVDGNNLEMILDGNTITAEIDGSKIVFSNAPPPADESEGESGTVTHALDGITITLELPEKGWCTERDPAVWTMPSLYLYNVPSLRKKRMYQPSIEIMAYESTAEFDLVFDEGFKHRVDIGSRNIGGIDMAGRRWTTDLSGMDFTDKDKIEHTEYIGVYGDNRGIHVLIDDFDADSGEVRAIIDSIVFTVGG